MRIPGRFLEDDLLGVRFAVNVFIGTAVTWATLRALADANPIWAIASMIASSDPVWNQAKRTFRGRTMNAAVGCVVGLVFLLVGGPREWKLPVALAISVLLSIYVVRVQVMWRQAPITAAIVIASGVAHQSRIVGIEHGLHKVAEVIFGCLVGVSVSWLMAKVWPVTPRAAEAQP
ncbi:MAG: FUSC family protein [Deltaproteobacteria bacterium]